MKIDLSHILTDLLLEIAQDGNTLFEISDEEVIEHGEAKVQLVEGCSYEYQFNNADIRFKNSSKNKIISFSKFGIHKGDLNPNIYVGTHTLEIVDSKENDLGILAIEVRSIKQEYRTDYRFMLESITEKCTDLIMQIDAPIIQNFETDFDVDSKTVYQRFSFVKALIDSKEFEEAIQKIISNPTTKWQKENEEKDIRSVKRFNQKSLKQIISRGNRVLISKEHFLNKNYGIDSLPLKIEGTRKTESIDTVDNRFIKHALQEFLSFCENCEAKFEEYSTAKLEANTLSNKISNILNQSFFKEVARPTSLKLNSPVLQRKSGYREVLSAWLKFDLAAKLIWHGGDNVYDAGKKDIATLYEYWLFFTLLEILEDVFNIEPKSIQSLIQYDKNKLSLNLKQGKAVALFGVFNAPSRNLNIQFTYNRSFGGGKSYPAAGSYTTTLRPDYTLSIWPEYIGSEKEAEEKELITHIHFDAKYKVKNFYELITKSEGAELSIKENEDLIKEEEDEIVKGTFKNQDLLKMHAYKDAIRRTAGAYVLYPGEGEDKPLRGFHELIPGLGAFVIKPNKNESDNEYLKKFILKVIDNFMDRASQRENTAFKIYDIHKNPKVDYLDDGETPNILNEPFPEYITEKKLIPDETFVLIGYYKNKEHLNWILKTNFYNFRTGKGKGSLPLGFKEVSACYIVLHGLGETQTNKIFKLKDNGPKIWSKENLQKEGYPTIPNGDLYIMYEIEKESSNEFNNAKFDIRRLPNFASFRDSPKPISVTISELMGVINK